MRPLHFGHSIDPSQVMTCTAAGMPKQELHHMAAIRNFNTLAATYLPPRGIRGFFFRYKNVHRVIFLFGKSGNPGDVERNDGNEYYALAGG